MITPTEGAELSELISRFADENASGGLAVADICSAAREHFASCAADSDDSVLVQALVRTRDAARRQKQFELADALRKHLLEAYSVSLHDAEIAGATVKATPGRTDDVKGLRIKILGLARDALDASTAAHDCAGAEEVVNSAAMQILECLRSSPRRQPVLHGRQHSDVAITMALAGSDNVELFNLLAEGQADELQRTARQTRGVVAAQIVERYAAAGVRPQDCPRLFACAADIMRQHGFAETRTLRDLEAGTFSLFSERPLRWLFRHTTQLGRRSAVPRDGGAAAEEAVQALNRACVGADGSVALPLVLDLGCGFGTSSLGMACADASCAVLAVDASAHCTRFARALARRWGLPPERLQYRHSSAKAALDAVAAAYRGPVKLVMVNFPTPFAEATPGGAEPQTEAEANADGTSDADATADAEADGGGGGG
mmetsp:Transcript_62961/g.204057  ORF Transcript_62961/g.204057 Transcript_62961/m.204057 type:complete len:429 (-) Transcript_62961:184-1470(-)